MVRMRFVGCVGFAIANTLGAFGGTWVSLRVLGVT